MTVCVCVSFGESLPSFIRHVAKFETLVSYISIENFPSLLHVQKHLQRFILIMTANLTFDFLSMSTVINPMILNDQCSAGSVEVRTNFML